MNTNLAIANDHAGVALKQTLVAAARKLNLTPLDLGVNTDDSVDYPDQAYAVCTAIEDGRATRGVLICGSGVGMSMAANRYSHIRAALCFTPEVARLARAHNDANVLVLGARLIDEATAVACLEAFLTTEFEGGRHQRRVEKLNP